MVARHRNFSNMDYNVEQLDDDPLSDGGEEFISPEHQALLNDGLDRVRDIIGDATQSSLSDKAIKDVLWECHFDIEETVQWAIEEQERILQAQQRKGVLLYFFPPLPFFRSTIVSGRIVAVRRLSSTTLISVSVELNLPSAPSHTMKDLPPLPVERELGYGEYAPPVIGLRRVIEEPEADLGYGQYSPPVLEEEEHDGRSRIPLIKQAQQPYESQLDAESGIRRNLSTISERTERTEPSPNWPPRQRYLSLEIPRPPSTITTSYGQAVDSPMDTTINSLNPNLIPVSPSDSAIQRLSFFEPPPSLPPSESDSYQSETFPKPPSEPVPPIDTIPDIPDLNSKSSRNVPPQATSQPPKKSKLAMLASSRASTSSIRSESSRSAGTDVSGSVKTYPNLRPSAESIAPESVVSQYAPSSTSSHVRRAIETALQMEVHDHAPATPPLDSRTPTPTPTPSRPTPAPSRPSAPTPSKVPDKPASVSSSRPTSKLAQLAQANKVSRNPTPEIVSGPPRLPPERTQYLTPVANGPTVTTAITTSYQSLYSLTNPNRSDSGRLVVVPLPSGPSSTAGEPKKSKLAMKIKKAQEKPPPQATVAEPPPPPVPSMFLPVTATRTRASPSAFATLLLDDASVAHSEDGPRRRSRQVTPTKIPDLFASSGSAFDGPSPDDIVMNARRDTSLGQTKSTASSRPLTSKS
ncbi:HBS1-N domain-containing protein [Mycena indigotica]|uniref:HBS1-N domain-containing protein n=1 Tax=Mycena indigotica TaxID=2126181 RepID=A0A8H6SKS3_9AGAR|nr:HBS1-N domain-containing protein [Mycena indigotica]KAF7301550.1 HBS1-N domain-containing protein [Mycena indigotica]